MGRFVFVFCAFFLFHSVHAQTNGLDAARQLLKNGEYEKAYSAYGALSNDHVNSAVFHFEYGQSALRVKKWKKAIIELSIAESLGHSSARLFGDRAMASAALKDFDNAINDYSKAIFLGEQSSFFLNRGVVFLEVGQYEKAIRDFNSCGRFKGAPNKAELYLGHAYLKLEDRVQAVGHYEKYLEEVDDAEVNYTVSVIEAEREDYKRALSHINRSLKLEPKNVKFLDFRAEVKIRMNNYKSAIVDLNIVEEIAPNDVLHFVERGTAYHKLGEFNKAIGDYESALKLKPNEIGVLMLMAASLQAQKDYSRAIKSLVEVWKMDTSRIEVLIHIADCYMVQEKYEVAIHYYDLYIKRDQTAHTPYRKRADAYFHRSMYSEAISDYSIVLKKHPEHPIAFNNRGMSLYHVGDKSEGCKDLQKAHDLGYSQSYLILKRNCAEVLSTTR